MAEPTHIVVRNAQEHNLKGVDVRIPRHAMVVFTGVSGSGKSSLVHDTLYKEGQRRFMESLSAYARQFLGQMERPEVDSVEGISPTLSIDQKTVNRNPRSTVGTITEIHDHLRLLYARLGVPHCPDCGTEIQRMGAEQVADRILEEGAHRRVQILAPVIQERKGEYRKQMLQLATDGWVRARVDGEMVRLDDPPTLERYKKHTIEVVVDRLKPSQADWSRLHEAVETAAEMGQQVVTVLIDDEESTFSTARACPNHPERGITELEPRFFSFNAPQGACPTCDGLGELHQFEKSLLIDPGLPLPKAVRVLNADGKVPFGRLDADGLAQIEAALGIEKGTVFAQWTDDQKQRFLHGDPSIAYTARWERDGMQRQRVYPWRGLLPLMERIWHYTKFPGFDAYRSRRTCPDCGGARLGPMSRSVLFRDTPLHELAVMPVGQLHRWFQELQLEGTEAIVGELLVAELRERLGFLDQVGLSYLNLSRSAATLSGGESQRIRLASQVGSGLQGVTYVLDEPSIGLHPRDNLRLLEAMARLRDRGNTLLVVEHDPETMWAADWLVDIGPGAGRDGGVLTAEGPPSVFAQGDSITSEYLRGDRSIAMPTERRAQTEGELWVRGAVQNNLQQLDVAFPLGVFTVVTGVSGSGKSSLVFHCLEEGLGRVLAGDPAGEGYKAIEGAEPVEKLIRINQRPIGRTPRSNPATYTGAMGIIRDLLASTPEAQARGYTKSRFSFNVPGGRCEECNGAGVKTVEMQFLPDVLVTCGACGGRRFNRETLEVTWKGLDVHQILQLTVAEAYEFFERIPKLERILRTLLDVGLEYVSLGQPSTTLSGGEAQRMKLASELQRPTSGHTVYLLDEPTTGLHLADVDKLLRSLQALVDRGHTVVVVEHHTDVIKCADHLIDLGPEGGNGGGRVVGEGTPEHLATLDTPTGRALAELPEFGGVRELHEEAPLAAESMSRPDHLLVEGARKHNLQSVDVSIPHGKMTVVTGVSGSGKSSLAFDTIFAEGQRRYVESLSTYARRFLGRIDRAPLDRLEGLQPAIAIDQVSASNNPRSTVSTVTEIHDVLRLLYARVGVPHCPHCDRILEAFSASEAARMLAGQFEEAGWVVAPLAPAEDPSLRRQILQQAGWGRLLTEDRAEVRLEDAEAAEALLAVGTWLVLDRLKPSTAARSRLSEAVAHGYKLGHGRVLFVPRGEGEARMLLERPLCPEHGLIHAELTPRHFSFNSRQGACETCDGTGLVERLQPRGGVRRSGPILDAVHPEAARLLRRRKTARRALGELWGYTTWAQLPEVQDLSAVQWHQLLHGDGDWPGVAELMSEAGAAVDWKPVTATCPSCKGGRLRPELRAVRLHGLGLHEFSDLTVTEAHEAVSGWTFSEEHAPVADRPVEELTRRLHFLGEVGLGYLQLSRRANSLSGGESQRIRLASQLGSSLTGVTYVLDEPTIGLHPRDTDRLLQSLEELRDQGNTLVVVEHDPDTIKRADHLLELGPLGGREGGLVMAQGTLEDLKASGRSLTGSWLSGKRTMPEPIPRPKKAGEITLLGANLHNLKGNALKIPLGQWICFTGVSGSGKSTLIMDTLAPALADQVQRKTPTGPFTSFHLEGQVDGVVIVDQKPLGQSPRSTPVTVTKVYDKIRRLFASTPGAMERGWKAGRFSYNASAGRCPQCEGRGSILVEMHFLPDVWVTCDMCHGKRFGRETLEVRFKGKSIADVLAMRVDEAVGFFKNQRAIHKHVKALEDVGLGYIELGQSVGTLSGGEAQRVKLASELVSRRGKRIYILDEPTTGLHLEDVSKLIGVLQALVRAGHTVITIEHHLDMIEQAHTVIELGPEGGEAGGRLIARGTPKTLAGKPTPTGRALAEHMGLRPAED